MTCHFIESRTRRYVKWYGLLSFARNLSAKYGKKILDTATKTGLGAVKTVSKLWKQNLYLKQIQKCWGNSYSYSKKRWNIEQIKTSILKWNIKKYINF